MKERPYDAEDVLQELIERHPQVLGGDDAPHGPLVLIRREAGIADREDGGDRWSLDHLYVDADGIPTLVEVKRSSDTRSRREVVAQMLDYASNARVSFSAERMREWLGDGGDDALREAFGIEDPDAFWETVATNLKAERFRLVFVADRIGAELRRIIEYLNRQMNSTELLAIEVKQYVDEGGAHQTIVPRVIGDTTEARDAKRSSRRMKPLDRDRFHATLAAHDPTAAQLASQIFDWAESESRLNVRFTGTGCSFETGRGPLIKLWVYDPWIDRPLEVHFATLMTHDDVWGERDADRLRRDLEELGLVFEGIPRSPGASIEPLTDEIRRKRFFRRLTDVLYALQPG